MRASSALTSTSASAPVGSGVAPTGVTGPASRTAERRRRVGVGSGAWKSGLRLGTTGLAGVPAAAWSSPSSSSVDRSASGAVVSAAAASSSASASTVAACSVGWAASTVSARSATEAWPARPSAPRGPPRRARPARPARGGLGPRGPLARRSLGNLLGRRGGGLRAALRPPPRSQPPRTRRRSPRVRGCRASRRQGRARPPEQPPPSSSSLGSRALARARGPGRRRRRLSGLGGALSALAARRSEEGRCVGVGRGGCRVVGCHQAASRQVRCDHTLGRGRQHRTGAVRSRHAASAADGSRLATPENGSRWARPRDRMPSTLSSATPCRCLTLDWVRTTGRSPSRLRCRAVPAPIASPRGDAAAAARRSHAARSECRRGVRQVWCVVRPSAVSHSPSP